MINCRIVFNESCLKCGKVEGKMVKIGAFYMCQKCFEDEFNVADIEVGSEANKNYYNWLEIYKER